jgi:hypothetical protein
MTDTKNPFGFPFPTITKVEGKPGYLSVKLLKQQMNENAMAVQSNRGGGQLGHLSLTLTAADYLARANVAFNPPVHPGDVPIHPVGATAAQITESNRQFLQDQTEFKEYTTVHQALKSLLLVAVKDVFLDTLKDDDVGYANVDLRDMIAHLQTQYGQLTQDELQANTERLKDPWEPSPDIETLWKRKRDCQRLATAGQDPITDPTAVRHLLTVLEQTGVFADAVRDWRKRPHAQQTYANFETDFTKANEERVRLLTADGAGYHGANAATAAATAAAATAAAAAAAASTATAAPPATQPPPFVLSNGVPMFYCWTHGLGKNRAHTSGTCQNKADGHKDEATADNMMGGNNTIMGGGRRRPPQH